MLKLKKQLNKIKANLDHIKSKKSGEKAYYFIVREAGFYEDVRGSDGLVVQEYGAELATNAWLKFWEILSHFFRDYLENLNKHNPELKTFHVAEAPGNFIICLNHFLSEMKNISWDWLAESYVEDSNLGTLGDHYGIIKKFKNKWLLGVEENGDICSSANIRSFAHEIPNLIGRVDLYTGDGKFETHDHHEEERLNLRILYGQVLCCLRTLSIGGHAVIKGFTTFETPTICLLYLMRLTFWELYLFKPKTSRGANSEMYIIAKDFRGINSSTINKLLNWFDYVPDDVLHYFGLFKDEDMPEDFLNQIVEISEKRTKIQAKHLERNLQLYEEYALGKKLMDLPKDMAEVRKKCASKWIEKNKMHELDFEDRMLV